jgi:DNA-directed RNA polymerase specialized sigma24 family protein
MKAQGKQNPPKRIPEFATYEEEAEFWDKFSPEDFPNEFEDIDVSFAKPLEVVRVKNWRKALVVALSKLSLQERDVLSLSMLGLSEAQISRVTGYSASYCHKNLREARRKTR